MADDTPQESTQRGQLVGERLSRGVAAEETIELVRVSEVKQAGRPRRDITVMRRRLVRRRIARRPY